jgi:hypothetical protein
VIPTRRPSASGTYKQVASYRLVAIMIFQICCVAPVLAQSPGVIGKWDVEIVFANANQYSLRFEGLADGKGSLLLLDPRSTTWEGAKHSEGTWTRGEGNSMTLSAPVEFAIGNVGRDAGTLILKGTFETEDLITGQTEFSPVGTDTPSKKGTFQATRQK